LILPELGIFLEAAEVQITPVVVMVLVGRGVADQVGEDNQEMVVLALL